MNAKQKLHQTKLSLWANHFKDQAESGLTVKNWCDKNNISIHSYNYWKHALKEEYIDSVLPDIVSLSSLTSPLPASNDIPVPTKHRPLVQPSMSYSLESPDLRNSCDNHSIHVVIGETELSFGPSISDEMICKIIRAVRYA